MNLKTLSFVTALLALISGAVFLAQRPDTSTSNDPRVGATLLDNTVLGKTTKIRLSDQGKKVLIEKLPDGSWAVADYYGFPADFTKLSQFVEEVGRTKVDRFVTARKDRLDRFEFKDSCITLLDTAGKEVWSLTLGKTLESGSRLLRFGNEERAYTGRLNTWIDADAKAWADTSLLKLKNEEIASLSLSFAGAPELVLKRAKKEDSFTADKAVEGKTLKADKVSSILNALSGLRFTDTSATDDAKAVEAAKYSRTVKLTTFAGNTLTLVLGRKPEQKKEVPLKTKEPKTAGAETVSAAKEETIPAGPVFVQISDSDTKAPINALMKKRSFQVMDHAFTTLPQSADELFEPAKK